MREIEINDEEMTLIPSPGAILVLSEQFDGISPSDPGYPAERICRDIVGVSCPEIIFMQADSFDVVTIQPRPGLLFNITNARQVTELLTGSWPTIHRGEAYATAVEACMEQIEGRKSIADVRSAFIKAAKSAGVFIREGR